jgi:enolase-phosphatase E1
VVDFTGVRHVIVDIEGTTSASAFVYDVLFPYARERFAPWIEAHASESETAAVIASVGAEIGVADPAHDQVVTALTDWTDADRKVTPLKTLQGLIWEQGFANGDLTSHFFPDAITALSNWHDAGLPISVYSSGSVLAQRNWYAHSPAGDLTGWMSGKREASAYRAIAEAIGADPGSLLFCSDVVAELVAASDAGWQVVRVRRAGEPHAVEDSTYPEVDEMTEIHLA